MSVLVCILVSFFCSFLHNKSILWYYSIMFDFIKIHLTLHGVDTIIHLHLFVRNKIAEKAGKRGYI